MFVCIDATLRYKFQAHCSKTMDEDKLYDMVKDQIGKLPTMKHSTAYMYDQIMGFYHAVSWSKELWLQILLAVHVILLLLVLFARKYAFLQGVIFLSSTAAVFMSERLNQIAKARWREFSTQNYFDEHGVFVGVVFAAPLMIILTIQLVLTLVDASRLVVKVKRLELGIEKSKKKDN